MAAPVLYSDEGCYILARITHMLVGQKSPTVMWLGSPKTIILTKEYPESAYFADQVVPRELSLSLFVFILDPAQLCPTMELPWVDRPELNEDRRSYIPKFMPCSLGAEFK